MLVHTTNYRNTFIKVSEDTKATTGLPATKPGSIADVQHSLVRERPYELTSDDLLFEVHAIRNGIPEADRTAAREAFFAKPQACLRASPLVKQFGWGIHHDDQERIALFAVDSPEYAALIERDDVKLVSGMRSKRA